MPADWQNADCRLCKLPCCSLQSTVLLPCSQTACFLQFCSPQEQTFHHRLSMFPQPRGVPGTTHKPCKTLGFSPLWLLGASRKHPRASQTPPKASWRPPIASRKPPGDLLRAPWDCLTAPTGLQKASHNIKKASRSFPRRQRKAFIQ